MVGESEKKRVAPYLRLTNRDLHDKVAWFIERGRLTSYFFLLHLLARDPEQPYRILYAFIRREDTLIPSGRPGKSTRQWQRCSVIWPSKESALLNT